MDRAQLADWIDAYERAWRTPGTEVLGGLFTADATYSPGPFEPTAHGLDEIATAVGGGARRAPTSPSA